MFWTSVAVFLVLVGTRCAAFEEKDMICSDNFCKNYIVEHGCPELSEACRVQNSTHNGVRLPYPDICNCCTYCITNLGYDELCSTGSPGMPPPAAICGPRLTCTRNTGRPATCQYMKTPCTKKQNEWDERRIKGTLGMTEVRPKCDDDGNFLPAHCIPGSLCYCLTPEGNRIFGEIPFLDPSDEYRMTCGTIKFELYPRLTYLKFCFVPRQQNVIYMVSKRYPKTDMDDFLVVQKDARLTIRQLLMVDKLTTRSSRLCAAGCSLNSWKAAQSVNPKFREMALTARCNDHGLYDALQCMMGGENADCVYVDPVTGEPRLDVKTVPYSELKLKGSACSDSAFHNRDTYESVCEALRKSLDNSKPSTANSAARIYNYDKPKCQPDGMFGRVQQLDKELICVDPCGLPIDAFRASVDSEEAKTMNCNCARAVFVLKAAGVAELPSCDSRGNFEAQQRNRNQCFCVDCNGDQTVKEVNIDVVDQSCPLDCTYDDRPCNTSSSFL